MALRPAAPTTSFGHTSAAYWNMVGPFGGITAATALNAVLQHPQRLGDPVALTVNLLRRWQTGPSRSRPVPARTNRSTQHWVVELQQAGATAMTACTAVHGVRRDTWRASATRRCRLCRRRPHVPCGPQAWHASPVEWINRYEVLFVEGWLSAVWDGADDGAGDASLSQLWMRDHPPRPLDFASLTALADVFFPRIWLRGPAGCRPAPCR
jgi:hypothetical protein